MGRITERCRNVAVRIISVIRTVIGRKTRVIVDDNEAILEIISLWRWYREDNLRVNQPYAFRGIDDPKYPEIRKAYDIAIARRDISLSLFVIAINEYIDSRIKEVAGK